MYSIALLVLLALAAISTVRGLRRRSWLAMGIGLGIAAATLTVFGLFSAWGQMLWFEVVGFVDRFWTVAVATLLVSVVAALAASLLVALVTLPARHAARRARRTGMLVAALAGAVWGLASWSIVYRWLLRVPTGTREPIFGRDVGFYLFTLPLIDSLFSLLLLATLISAIVATWSTHGRRPQDLHLQLVKPWRSSRATTTEGRASRRGRHLFRDALAALVSSAPEGTPAGAGPAPEGTTAAALERARTAFDEYRKLTAESHFEEAGATLREVGEAHGPAMPDGILPNR